MSVTDEIAKERARQTKRYSLRHDDEYKADELTRAAIHYATAGLLSNELSGVKWPWDLRAWKPEGHRRNLIRAAALIVADIERYDRREARSRR